jgi:hypothetical protein
MPNAADLALSRADSAVQNAEVLLAEAWEDPAVRVPATAALEKLAASRRMLAAAAAAWSDRHHG